MPMGELNVSPTFVAVNMKLKMEWDTIAKERGLKMLHTIIVDDVVMYGLTAKKILAYFRKVLDVLKHHHATLKP